MDNLFLGTGASEGIPCPFCRCDYCRNARNSEKDNRSRSSFRIDARHQIDFNSDHFQQMNKFGLDVYDLEHLLVTHTHDDHFNLMEIFAKECAVTEEKRPDLNLYMSEQAARWTQDLFQVYFRKTMEHMADFKFGYNIVPLQAYEVYSVGDLIVEPILGNHKGFGIDEWAFNYLITYPDGRLLLYACDTGWYSDNNWNYLKNRSIDTLVLECTYGGRIDRGTYVDGHLDILNFNMMLKHMQLNEMIHINTSIFATHINHKHHLMHDSLQQEFDKGDFKVIVAYDGLVI